LTISSYAQDKTIKQAREGLMKVGTASCVIKRAGADFSVYIPDNHPDKGQKNAREVYCLILVPTIRI
jgi:hypothetical protein